MSYGRKSIGLAGPVALSQAHNRELQLAKGAVAAGFLLLLDGRRLTASRIFLAGAFDNYIRGESARRIGLLPSWADHPTAAGNTALRGARMLLLAVSRRQHILDSVLAATDHVELASDPRFQRPQVLDRPDGLFHWRYCKGSLPEMNILPVSKLSRRYGESK